MKKNFLPRWLFLMAFILTITFAGCSETAPNQNLVSDAVAVDSANAANSVDPAMVGSMTATGKAVPTTDQQKLPNATVRPEDFGAIGDGVTNDTDAFGKLSNYINANGGGKIALSPKTYIVGKQTFARGTGKGYAYKAASIISITGCTKPVIIQGNGAVLKIASGLKFGSFDPVTGNVYKPGSMPFTNADYTADIGAIIDVTKNASVKITGVELDGNSGNIVLGGQWGDTGYQRLAYGIRAYNNEALHVENIYTHHHGTDGVVIGYSGATADMPSKPVFLLNVRSEYNSRQGLSWVGGVGLTAINCKFNHTGKGTFSSAPGAGIDIEAESAVIRKGVFINIEAGNNTGAAMVADMGDSADVHFIDSKFYGTSTLAIWPAKPRFTFTRCLIAGGAVHAYVASAESDRTRFENCIFSADETFNGIAAKGYYTLADFTSQNPVFDSCTFVSHQAGISLPLTSSKATYRNVTMLQDGSTATALSRGMFEGINTITQATGTNDLNGSINFGKLSVTGAVVGIAVSSGGQVPGTALPGTSTVTSVGRNNLNYQQKITKGDRAPISGTWNAGDKVINNLPAIGKPKGWVCIVGGSPGTWINEGDI